MNVLLGAKRFNLCVTVPVNHTESGLERVEVVCRLQRNSPSIKNYHIECGIRQQSRFSKQSVLPIGHGS
jgi:hypothetical protein